MNAQTQFLPISTYMSNECNSDGCDFLIHFSRTLYTKRPLTLILTTIGRKIELSGRRGSLPLEMAIVRRDSQRGNQYTSKRGGFPTAEGENTCYKPASVAQWVRHRPCDLEVPSFDPSTSSNPEWKEGGKKEEGTHFNYGYRKEDGNVLFNDALNTFYLRLYGVGHMVKDHSDSERGNPLPPHRLIFPISSKGSFICIIPQTGLIAHQDYLR